MSATLAFFGVKPLQLAFNALKISITGTAAQERFGTRYIPPRRRYPPWFLKQNRARYNEDLTPENREFLKQVICEKYGPMGESSGVYTYLHTPLKQEPILRGTWFPNCRRSGLIGIKLGILPQWTVDGQRLMTTLLQIIDNHVIKYIPPEEFVVIKKWRARKFRTEGHLGCLVVGAVNCDPQMFTKEYNGLFAESGVMPKKLLTRFPIHPEAAIQPGTQLYAGHFKVGDVIDVTGITVFRGFQGVMKRWGFAGLPASHGVTKSHRRPGCIGGPKARVWPGKKMPGCVGNTLRTSRGLKILKIDHKYNVIYVNGTSVPGDVNSFVFLHDTVLPLRKLKESPRFPTYYPEDYAENPLPTEEFDASLFDFNSPSIVFQEEKVKKKK